MSIFLRVAYEKDVGKVRVAVVERDLHRRTGRHILQRAVDGLQFGHGQVGGEHTCVSVRHDDHRDAPHAGGNVQRHSRLVRYVVTCNQGVE